MDETAEVSGAHEAPGSNGVNRDIVNGLADLVKRAGAISQSIADLFDIAPSELLALFKLEEVMTMKELAQHMGCDASFVTTIAYTLEQRGLARREPSLRDRRVKNLVLTLEGIAAKERMMRELALRMPWCYALEEKERHLFLALIQKLLAAETEYASRPGGGEPVTTAAVTTSWSMSRLDR
ncbi:MAG: MarR family winged helix-turn-helix transcriptional regulator [Streptosporangiaceae bacterium]